MENRSFKLWKVVELREELKRRSLNSVGPKALLVQRLEASVSSENPQVQDDDNYTECIEEKDEPEVLTSDEMEQNRFSTQDEMEDMSGESPRVSDSEIKEVPDIEKNAPEEMTSFPGLDTSKSMPSSDGILCESEEGNVKNGGKNSVGSDDTKVERLRDVSPSSRDDDRRPRKRSRSKSPRRSKGDGRQDTLENIYLTRASEEPPNWEGRTDVHLDWYNSDLNVIIDSCGLKARPLSVGGFNFMWGGVRANYGVMPEVLLTNGYKKIAYKLTVSEFLDVSDDVTQIGSPHVIRIGWTLDTGDFSVGENSTSWGFGGNAETVHNGVSADYGEDIKEKDVVVAWLEIQSTKIVMGFTKNGYDFGVAFEVESSAFAPEQCLFPQIMLKNVAISVQFEKDDSNQYPDDLIFIGDLPIEHRCRGQLPPPSKHQCEILMMCGLPGCGKTYWTAEHSKSNPEMRYCILGTNLCLDKMKTMGKVRKNNPAGRCGMLIEKSTKCLNQLIEVASNRRKNYILDQTNVYPGAQRRKMRPFDGFIRKAVVIVPTDEEFRRRIDKRTREEGKDVPESAVLEMKANFKIPEDDGIFQEVIFPELQREEAQDLVLKYNADGNAAKPPPEKRVRNDNHELRQSSSSSRRDDSGSRRHSGRDRDDGARGRRRSRSRSRSRSPFDRERRSSGYSARRPPYDSRRPPYDDNKFEDRRGTGGFRSHGDFQGHNDFGGRYGGFGRDRGGDRSSGRGGGFGGRGRGGYDDRRRDPGNRGGRRRDDFGRNGGHGYRGGRFMSGGMRGDRGGFQGRSESDNFYGRRRDRGGYGGADRGGYRGGSDRGGRGGALGRPAFYRDRFSDEGQFGGERNRGSRGDYSGGNDRYQNPYASYSSQVEPRGRQQPSSELESPRASGRPSRFTDSQDDAPSVVHSGTYRPSASSGSSYGAPQSGMNQRFQSPKVEQSRLPDTGHRSYGSSYSAQLASASASGQPQACEKRPSRFDDAGLPTGPTLSQAPFTRPPPPVDARSDSRDSGPQRGHAYRDPRVNQLQSQLEQQDQLPGDPRNSRTSSDIRDISQPKSDQVGSNTGYSQHRHFQQPPPNYNYQHQHSYQSTTGSGAGSTEQDGSANYAVYYGQQSSQYPPSVQTSSSVAPVSSASTSSQPGQSYDSYYTQQQYSTGEAYNYGTAYSQTGLRNQSATPYSGYDYTVYNQQFYSQPPPGQ